MTGSEDTDLTQLLQAWSNGETQALERLTPRVYHELHRIARRHMSREQPDHPLQPTALINEAYLRLIRWKTAHWQNRAHFFGVSAELMRRILVDAARERRGLKRNAPGGHVEFDEEILADQGNRHDVLALDAALKKLAEFDSQKARIVELKFFGGLNTQETAVVVGTSQRTVEREWALAKAWLYKEILVY